MLTYDTPAYILIARNRNIGEAMKRLKKNTYWLAVVTLWSLVFFVFTGRFPTAKASEINAPEPHISIDSMTVLVNKAVNGWSAYDYSYYVRLEMYHNRRVLDSLAATWR